jgi:hypothetical protein
MEIFEEGKKKKEWKAGKGWKGTTKAMLDKHPDKFSKSACKKKGKKKGKLCPYAIASSMKKKGDKAHYKDQPSTLEGKPKKKKKFREWISEKHPNSKMGE